MTYQLPESLSDLDRAINKLDFYRLFKALCIEFEIDILAVFDMNNWPDEEIIESLMIVANSPERINLDLDAVSIPPQNPIFHNMRNKMIYDVWPSKTMQEQIDFCGDVKGSIGIAIPLHTANGRHFSYWLMTSEAIEHQIDYNQLIYSSKLLFQKFYQDIILPVTIPIISPRELEVIRWSSEGKTSVEIAIILGLSEHTINSYTTKILQKLQVVNRAQMVATSIRMGLIQ